VISCYIAVNRFYIGQNSRFHHIGHFLKVHRLFLEV